MGAVHVVPVGGVAVEVHFAGIKIRINGFDAQVLDQPEGGQQRAFHKALAKTNEKKPSMPALRRLSRRSCAASF